MKKMIKKSMSILLVACMLVMLIPELKSETFAATLEAPFPYERDDGVWLFPLEDTGAWKKFSDWAGCPGWGNCPFHKDQSHFGDNDHNQSWNYEYGHNGIDIGATGQIIAAASGKMYANNDISNGGRGRTVVIEHQIGNGWSYYTVYQHMNSIYMELNGKDVDVGTPIGIVGNSGGDYGIHLHFAILMAESGIGSDLVYYSKLNEIEGKGWRTKIGEEFYGVGRILNNPSLSSPALKNNPIESPMGAKEALETHPGTVRYTFEKEEVTFKTNTTNIKNYINECKYYPCYAGLIVKQEAWIRSIPCHEDTANAEGYQIIAEENQLKKVSKGDTSYTAIGLYKNTVGHYWYKVNCVDKNGKKREGYIWAEAAEPVDKDDLKWDVEIDGVAYPSQHIQSKSFSIQGKISVKYTKMISVTGGINSSSYHKTVDTAGPYSLLDSPIDYALLFNNLPLGEYVYYVKVKCQNYYLPNSKAEPLLETKDLTLLLEPFVVISAPCNHNLEKINEVAATCEEHGNKEYWHCTACGTYFANAAAEVVTLPDRQVTNALGHNYQKGLCLRCKKINPDSVLSGIIGNINWTINSLSGELRFTGSGEMVDFKGAEDSYNDVAPWLECSSLIKSVKIEDGITSVGAYAFIGCDDLTKITLPRGLTRIGARAFYLCNELREIRIPADIRTIGPFAFYQCYNLANVYYDGIEKEWNLIDFGDDNAHYLANANIHFSECTHDGIGTAFEYTAKDEEKHIKSELCVRCDAVLSSVTEACADAGNDGFCDLCEGTLPKIIASGTCGGEGDGGNLNWELWDNSNLHIFGAGAMQNYDLSNTSPWSENLRYVKNVVIDEGVTTVGDYAFSDCYVLENIDMPSTIKSIGDYAFSGCDYSLKKMEIPDGVLNIGANAFSRCSALEEIKLPKSLNTIGNSAFSHCNSLTQIELHGQNLIVKENTFYGCNNLISVSLDEGVLLENNTTLKSCINLTEVMVSDTHERYFDIDGVLFDKRNSELIFYPRAKEDHEYIVPEGTVSIGAEAFFGCVNLTSVVIPSGVSYIGEWSFSNCTALEIVSIPLSVKNIGWNAFYQCISLEEIYYEGTEKQWYSFPKQGNDNLKEIVIHFQPCDHTDTVLTFNSLDNEQHEEKLICDDCDEMLSTKTVDCVDDNKDSQCDACYGKVLCKHIKTISAIRANVDKTHTITYKCVDCNEKISTPVTVSCSGYLNDSICDECGGYRTDVLYSGFCGENGGENLIWTLSSDGVLTISGSGAMGSSPWRSKKDEIKHIIIEDGVTYIDNAAFYYCTNVETVKFGNTIQEIGPYAFQKCGLAGSIILPESLLKINHEAFWECDRLKWVYFEGDVPEGDYLIFDEYVSIYYKSDRSGWDTTWDDWQDFDPEVDANYVWILGDYCLMEWDLKENPINKSGYCGGEGDGTNLSWSLSENSVLTISGQGAMADYGYNNEAPWGRYVYTVILENGITTIGTFAFSGNWELTGNLILPKTLTVIGDCAFSGCWFTGSLAIPENVKHIGDGAFAGCSNLTGELEIPENVRSIGDGAFNHCTNLGKTLTIPNLTRSIGADAFSECAFEEVYFAGCAPVNVSFDSFDAGVTLYYQEPYEGWTDNYYYDDADETWYGFDVKTWSDGTTALIGAGFCGADTDGWNIRWSYFSDGTLVLNGSGAMRDWDWDDTHETPPWMECSWSPYTYNIKKIVIEEGITRIGSSAFSGCDQMTEFPQIPISVKEIGKDAFAGWSGLNGTLVVPDGIERIEDYGFWYLSEQLECIVIPDSVKYIGAWAFTGYYSNNTPNVLFKGEPPMTSEEGLPFMEDAILYFEEGTDGWSGEDWNGYTIKSYVMENDHYYPEWKVIVDPECALDGVKTRTCLACSYFEKEDIPAIGHSYDEEVHAPTCETEGYTSLVCSNCGEGYRHEYVDSLGHNWDDGVITVEPMENMEGECKYTCSRCNDVKREPIPVKVHTHTYSGTIIDPTCTEKGYTEHLCSCGDSYVDTYVPAKGHLYNNAVPVAENPEKGHYQQCSRCNGFTDYQVHMDKNLDKKCDDCGYNIVLNTETHLKGDTNLDGEVNASDLTALARHVAKIQTVTDEYALQVSDVETDGIIDARDLTKLARYVAKIIPAL